MGWFYKVSDKELLEVRNQIFVEKGIPELKKNEFEFDPLKTSWHGQYDKSIQGYIYQFSRLKGEKHLERIEIYILKGSRWIQIHLNIFELQPELESMEQLKGVDGLQYHLPPNSLTKMRLRMDDIKGMPLLDYHFMFGGHKLRSFHTKAGFNQRVKELGNRIEQDLTNIDSFIKRWHELHEPNVVDWEGNRIEQK